MLTLPVSLKCIYLLDLFLTQVFKVPGRHLRSGLGYGVAGQKHKHHTKRQYAGRRQISGAAGRPPDGVSGVIAFGEFRNLDSRKRQSSHIRVHVFRGASAAGKQRDQRFSIFGDNALIYSSYRPEFLQEGLLTTLLPGKPRGMTYSIRATVNSTLPPIINGIEIFTLINMPFMPTNRSDGDSFNIYLKDTLDHCSLSISFLVFSVQAILELKKLFNGSREWEGDPCVPRNLIWKGLGCGYGEANYSRIISL